MLNQFVEFKLLKEENKNLLDLLDMRLRTIFQDFPITPREVLTEFSNLKIDFKSFFESGSDEKFFKVALITSPVGSLVTWFSPFDATELPSLDKDNRNILFCIHKGPLKSGFFFSVLQLVDVCKTQEPPLYLMSKDHPDGEAYPVISRVCKDGKTVVKAKEYFSLDIKFKEFDF